ncbi:MAG: hypothetical protein E7311_03565 [Clostridiales bacterium]|nr:hypothetical protein [Clostridiales bacterium]
MSKVYIMGILLSILLNNNVIMGVPVQNELELFLYTNEKTQNQLEIQYQNEEDLTNVISLLKEIPPEIVDCVDKLVLYDNEVEENVAGISKDRTVKLYDFSNYCVATQKHIICHEFAHIWGNKLMQYKVLDYHYTDYAEAVKEDNNYISSYSKKYIIEKNNYSEDFADSVAKYLISDKKLSKKYSNRQAYIEQMLDICEGGLYET